jgi:hypothetical protein
MVLSNFADPASLAAGLGLVSNAASGNLAIVDFSSAGTIADVGDKIDTNGVDEHESSGAEATFAYELTIMGGPRANDAMFIGVNGGTSPVLGSSNSIFTDDDQDAAGSS